MRQYRPGIILFIIFFITGLVCYKDYGISFDEPEQRRIGTVSYDYVFHGDDSLQRYYNRSYGVGFELPLIALEKKLHLVNSREQYLMRHLVTHIFFLISMFFGYLLVYRLYKSQFLACLAFILLVLMPRIYAHSYFNTKDIPLLCVVVITMAIGQLAFEKNKAKYYLLLGVICGYGTSIRVMELLFAYIFCAFLLIDLVTALVRKGKSLAVLKNLGVFIAGFALTLYTAWPFLWHDPLNKLMYAYDRFSKNEIIGAYFKGAKFIPGQMPREYLPFWMATTIPAIWLFAGAAGCILVVVLFFKKPLLYLTNTRERNFILFFGAFAVPFFSLIWFRFNIYDDWRHMFFIYPPLAMLAIFALSKIPKGRPQQLARMLFVAQSASVLFFMIRNHPFQQVYFNELISHKDEYLRKNFEFDYWGSSVKQGYDYILAHDNRPVITVAYSHEPLFNNYLMLTEEQKKRIRLVENSDDYDYHITNFRDHPEDFSFPEIVYNVKVLNSSVVRVYKLK